MLIDVKIPTTVGILTFISMINTTLNSLKARQVFIFQHFSFYKRLKFHVQLSRISKMFYYLRGPVLSQEMKLSCSFFANQKHAEFLSLMCLLKTGMLRSRVKNRKALGS